MNSLPLYECICIGQPNRQIQFLKIALATVLASLLGIGITSAYLLKESVMASKNFDSLDEVFRGPNRSHMYSLIWHTSFWECAQRRFWLFAFIECLALQACFNVFFYIFDH